MNSDAKRIYREAFGNDGDFCERLFDVFGDIAEQLTADGKTVSLLFPLPCVLQTEKEKVPAKYIFAAATDSEKRGCGYMSELIRRVCHDSETFYFLRPANRDLIAFYEKFGFKEIKGIGSGEAFPYIDVSKPHKTLAGGAEEGGTFPLMYRYSAPIKLNELHFGYSMF